MTVLRPFLLLLGLMGIWLGAGCRGGDPKPIAAEIDEPDFRRGQQLVKQERTQEALASFLKVIEKRGEQSSAESHLEAGLIYLRHSKDPVEAYHHFRQYLAQLPNSPQAAQVSELVNTAKLEFARTLPGQPLENQADRMALIEKLANAQRENEGLRAEIASLRNSAAAPVTRSVLAPAIGMPPRGPATTPPGLAIPVEDDSPITAAPVQSRPGASVPPRPTAVEAVPVTQSPARGSSTVVRTQPARPGAPISSAPRRHVVVQGEGLFGISRQYYGAGSVAKAKAIFEANRDVMKNEGDLRPGMELKIP